METNRLVSSLCYFSIFFAGFIFPIAVYFIVDNPEVKQHAKKALLSHLIPVITIPVIVLPLIFAGGEPTLLAFGGIMMFVIIGAINLGILIWNVVKGIKVLVN